MPRPERRAFRQLTTAAGLGPARFIADSRGRVSFVDLVASGTIEPPLESFRGRSILIRCKRQLAFVAALLQLDGIAARLVLCPSDLAPAHLPAVLAEAEVDAIVSDSADLAAPLLSDMPVLPCHVTGAGQYPLHPDQDRRTTTEWVLFTSGTSDRPKLVVHTLASLTGPLDDGLAAASDVVWSTFYDVRRYGGMQIMLRAFVGGGSMVLSQADEPVAAFLGRAGAYGVTHMSGTPSHWRRALMSTASDRISPRYIRLSGEIADQAILDNLAAAFPAATIAHAFASTEAGVAFSVEDGFAGFPAALVDQSGAKAELRVVDGSLRIRSARAAARYLGRRGMLRDTEGFVDTGDMLTLHDGRYHFAGRREGVINVGGQKVHPEEVEAVINRLPSVQMARVRAHRSPITGSLVVADIVVQPSSAQAPFAAIKAEILAACRAALPAHKVPAMLRAVPSLELAASGKLVRRHA
ncbi:MAG TPA: class I adenylate-forming enzyme family protein [Stellaceae bacterium]|nr:class I adenylate-forming enzyme family protein [Stellaceae bacterium]